MSLTEVVQAYWMPGCSSCLRMKEFISKSGREWVAINADEDLEARAELAANGLVLPVARLGDRWVNGVDLAAVAELLEVPYEPPVILPSPELAARYNLNLDVARSIITQMTDEMFAVAMPNRKRPMFDVANQVASVMRSFLAAYYDDKHDSGFYAKPDLPTLIVFRDGAPVKKMFGAKNKRQLTRALNEIASAAPDAGTAAP